MLLNVSCHLSLWRAACIGGFGFTPICTSSAEKIHASDHQGIPSKQAPCSGLPKDNQSTLKITRLVFLEYKQKIKLF